MSRAANILSLISLCAVALAFSLTHLGFPPVGFEGAIVFGGLALWAGILSAVAAAFLSAVLAYRRNARWRWPLGCAVFSGIVAVIVVRIT
jgi:hypothetical protein